MSTKGCVHSAAHCCAYFCIASGCMTGQRFKAVQYHRLCHQAPHIKYLGVKPGLVLHAQLVIHRLPWYNTHRLLVHALSCWYLRLLLSEAIFFPGQVSGTDENPTLLLLVNIGSLSSSGTIASQYASQAWFYYKRGCNVVHLACHCD